jgi:hypothetical protein
MAVDPRGREFFYFFKRFEDDKKLPPVFRRRGPSAGQSDQQAFWPQMTFGQSIKEGTPEFSRAFAR